MKNELTINGYDAYTMWGVSMGKDFVQTIDAPAPLKEFPSNESREHSGKQYVIPTAMGKPILQEREFALEFIIQAPTADEYKRRKDAFMAILQGARLDVKTAAYPSVTYHILYTGKNMIYSLNTARTIGTLTAKFIEPDPSNRVENQQKA